MPLYMDVHNLGDGVTLDAVAQAHQADLQTQGPYDVRTTRGCSALEYLNRIGCTEVRQSGPCAPDSGFTG